MSYRHTDEISRRTTDILASFEGLNGYSLCPESASQFGTINLHWLINTPERWLARDAWTEGQCGIYSLPMGSAKASRTIKVEMHQIGRGKPKFPHDYRSPERHEYNVESPIICTEKLSFQIHIVQGCSALILAVSYSMAGTIRTNQGQSGPPEST